MLIEHFAALPGWAITLSLLTMGCGGAAAAVPSGPFLSRAEITAPMRANVNSVFCCIANHLAEPSAPDGRVVMQWLVGLDGAVSNVQTVASAQQPEVARCLAQEIAQWRFPSPRGGEVEVIFPFGYHDARSFPAGFRLASVRNVVTARPDSFRSTLETASIKPHRLMGEAIEARLRKLYPPLARAKGIEAEVQIGVSLSPEGTVSETVLLRDEPRWCGFAAACEQALRESRWEPARDAAGNPLPIKFTFQCLFRFAD